MASWRHPPDCDALRRGVSCSPRVKPVHNARRATRCGTNSTLNTIPSGNLPPTPIRSAATVTVWKTINMGKFANTFALDRRVGCSRLQHRRLGPRNSGSTGLHPQRHENRPWSFLWCRWPNSAFGPTPHRWRTFMRAPNSWAFRLATAEIAPLLRLQYFNQPMENSSPLE